MQHLKNSVVLVKKGRKPTYNER